MKTIKLLSLVMLVLGLCSSQVQAQCSPGVSVDIIGELQGTSTPAASAGQGDWIDYNITVTLGSSQCEWTGATVTVTLPNLSEVTLAAGTLSLLPGNFQTYTAVAPYQVDYLDLGEYDDPFAHAFDPPGPDEVRTNVVVVGTSHRTDGGTQSAGGWANWDTTYVVDPVINVEKLAVPDGVCAQSTVPIVYTYTVTNIGDIDLENISLVDDTSPCETPGYVSGDVGSDGILGLSETWIYECIAPTPSVDVTNIATVTGQDVVFGYQVQDTATEDVTVNPPPEVSVDPPGLVICANGLPVQFCAVVAAETGTPPFTYEWTKLPDTTTVIGTEDCLTGITEAGEYCVKVIDAAGCDGTACAILEVIPHPDCIINSGPRSLCEGDTDPIQYCSTVLDADGYYWQIISGPATIPGDNDLPCVDVVPTGAVGTIVLQLEIFNNVPGAVPCGRLCDIDIVVGECGGGFCTFTQGYYGNAGGTQCDGMTTTAILIDLLNAADATTPGTDPVIVGALALDPGDTEGPSITFDTAACIILRLPCGGKPKALPGKLGNKNCTELTKPLIKKNNDAIGNVLVGQTVALTLNMRLHTIPCMEADGFDQALGGYEFPIADYICVQKEDGCIERYEIPESLQGETAETVLIAANMALAGDDELVDGAYEAASFINELFDECLTIVTCPIDPVEICDDECDNDFDGLVDGDDPDCHESICDDAIDNDGDGLTDCDDPDCELDLACAPS